MNKSGVVIAQAQAASPIKAAEYNPTTGVAVPLIIIEGATQVWDSALGKLVWVDPIEQTHTVPIIVGSAIPPNTNCTAAVPAESWLYAEIDRLREGNDRLLHQLAEARRWYQIEHGVDSAPMPVPPWEMT